MTYPPGLVEHNVDPPMLDIFFGAACSVPSPEGHLVDTTWKGNTLRPRQNGRHFAADIFKYILLNENVWIVTEISLTFAAKGSINNASSLSQIMVWRHPGDKPLSEPMMVTLLALICVDRPLWVKLVTNEFTTKITIICQASLRINLNRDNTNYKNYILFCCIYGPLFWRYVGDNTVFAIKWART